MAERSDGSASSRPPAGSVLGRYGAALGIVLASGVLHRALIQAVGPLPPFVTLYPAVVFVALLAGGGPGVLAIGLSVLTAWYLRRPIGVPALDDVVAGSVFVGANRSPSIPRSSSRS